MLSAESRENGERQILQPPLGVAVVLYTSRMYFCYVDESGCTGELPSATSQIQPIFATLGLIVDVSRIHDFTLKTRFAHRLMKLQHRFLDSRGKWSGGIVSSDAICQRSGNLLFDNP